MSKFKVGERYRFDREGDYHHNLVIEIKEIGTKYNGRKFYVYDVISGNDDAGCIIFDEGSEFEKHLVPVHDKCQPIVIYRNGRQVIALDKNSGKRGVAIGSPDDNFDFNTGAKLAFERLMAPEPLNCKICITKKSGCASLTVGRIYEIKNGKFSLDGGLTVPLGEPLYSIEDLKKFLRSENPDSNYKGANLSAFPVEFVEVVE